MEYHPPVVTRPSAAAPCRFGGIAAVLLALVLGAGESRAVTVATNGIYDAAGGGAVDGSATASPNDVASFTTRVLAANGLGFGGVIHFDLGADAAGSTLEATYATATKTLNISTSAGFNIQATSSATALSGRALVLPVTDTTNDNATISFGSITNGVTLEAVTSAGFTILSRSATGFPQDITVTALFSDGSTSVATSNIGNTAASDDTFFGFTAPAGLSITSITVDPANDALDARPVIDDFGFITSVPEPSTALLGCTTALLAFARRRR